MAQLEFWHAWFAWHPVRVDCHERYAWAWLRLAERKRCSIFINGGMQKVWLWAYRSIA